MLNLLQLKTFHAVVRRKSFTRAAAELGYSQSSVTTHVKALERELGAPLIEHCRFSRTVVLTDAGRRVFTYAGKILALAEETKATVNGETQAA
jgi:DNA-binding transcriptional LysR family regulator